MTSKQLLAIRVAELTKAKHEAKAKKDKKAAFIKKLLTELRS